MAPLTIPNGHKGALRRPLFGLSPGSVFGCTRERADLHGICLCLLRGKALRCCPVLVPCRIFGESVRVVRTNAR